MGCTEGPGRECVCVSCFCIWCNKFSCGGRNSYASGDSPIRSCNRPTCLPNTPQTRRICQAKKHWNSEWLTAWSVHLTCMFIHDDDGSISQHLTCMFIHDDDGSISQGAFFVGRGQSRSRFFDWPRLLCFSGIESIQKCTYLNVFNSTCLILRYIAWSGSGLRERNLTWLYWQYGQGRGPCHLAMPCELDRCDSVAGSLSWPRVPWPWRDLEEEKKGTCAPNRPKSSPPRPTPQEYM